MQVGGTKKEKHVNMSGTFRFRKCCNMLPRRVETVYKIQGMFTYCE